MQSVSRGPAGRHLCRAPPRTGRSRMWPKGSSRQPVGKQTVRPRSARGRLGRTWLITCRVHTPRVKAAAKSCRRGSERTAKFRSLKSTPDSRQICRCARATESLAACGESQPVPTMRPVSASAAKRRRPRAPAGGSTGAVTKAQDSRPRRAESKLYGREASWGEERIRALRRDAVQVEWQLPTAFCSGTRERFA